nr:MAG TPA: hypothetical protein [Bacteriophage sp.]
MLSGACLPFVVTFIHAYPGQPLWRLVRQAISGRCIRDVKLVLGVALSYNIDTFKFINKCSQLNGYLYYL